MLLTAIDQGPVAAIVLWLRGLWAYYRRYTHTAIHTASAAALTAFGLLIFIDPLFSVLAIASYILPPIVLYSMRADIGEASEPANVHTGQADTGTTWNSDSDTDSDGDDGDSDSDSDDGDTDSDGNDGDTDTDG